MVMALSSRANNAIAVVKKVVGRTLAVIRKHVDSRINQSATLATKLVALIPASSHLAELSAVLAQVLVIQKKRAMDATPYAPRMLMPPMVRNIYPFSQHQV